MALMQDLRTRLEKYREIDPVTGCWRWTGSHFSSGYGNIRVNGKTKSVHRTAFEVYHGTIDPLLVVKHSCDVKDCFNPDHINQGTISENTTEAHQRGQITAEHMRKCRDRRLEYFASRTACVHGHPYTTESTYVNKHGHRQCKICDKLRHREHEKAKHNGNDGSTVTAVQGEA